MAGTPTDDTPALSETITRQASVKAAARRPDAALTVVWPRALRNHQELGADALTVGRHPGEGGLRIADGTMSRAHVAITWDPNLGRHVLEELGSRNGTWRGGVAVVERQALSDGDVLRMGSVLAVYEASSRSGRDAGPVRVSPEAIPGDALSTRRLRQRVAQAAGDPSPVLLVGETGTGKEMIARELHRLSRRRGPLVPVNVAELSGELVESQLFGHERGAFTGADRAQPGLFRSADRGTLFLDEVGELEPALQPKFLRALQEGEVRPVGGTRAVAVDVRIVSATNRDLARDVEAERFRRDLYARLALWELKVPPLRERRADIVGWVDALHTRWAAARDLGIPVPLQLEPEALEAILLAPWPDNLRGLDRLVHRLAVEATPGEPITLGAVIEAAGLDPTPPAATDATDTERRPAPQTAEEMSAVMAQLDGSVRAAARHYGRDRRQIYRWLEAFGLREKEG